MTAVALTTEAYLFFSHFASSFYYCIFFYNFGNLFHTKVESTKQEINDSLVWLGQPIFFHKLLEFTQMTVIT